MRIVSSFLLMILVLFASASAPAYAQEEEEAGIELGQIIRNENGQVINGWTDGGGGLLIARNWDVASQSTIEKDDCCFSFSIFHRGDDYLYLITEAITQKPTGGVLTERVIRKKLFRPLPEEYEVICSIFWIDPIVSFATDNSQIIRSLVYNGDDFVEFRWFDDGHTCSYPD